MQKTIVVLQVPSAHVRGVLRQNVPSGFDLRIAESMSADHLRSLIRDADYAIAMDGGLDASVLEAAEQLKLVHKWGTGTDNIPVEQMRAMGVALARTAGSNATPVAEFAIGVMISVSRQIHRVDAALKRGQWIRDELWPVMWMLSGRTVGIVGLGTIGKRVAERLAAFGCHVLYHNRKRVSVEEEQRLNVEYADFDRLISSSDIITLHCPLTEETRGLIGRDQFRAMKTSAILLNFARAGVVPEVDLVWALREKEIAGAATDVFEMEPPHADNPLLAFDNVLVTPHCAAAAENNIEVGVKHLFRNIDLHSKGLPLPDSDLVFPGRQESAA